jgi:excisionase family DNA binding protein
MIPASFSGKLLPLGDLSGMWGCSVRHLRRLIASGQLGAVKVGDLIRVPEAEAQRFIAERFLPPKTEEPQCRRLAGTGNVATIVDGVIGRHRRGAR